MSETTTPAKYARLTPGERRKMVAEIRRQYKSGLSITDTAKHVGRSYGFVQRALSEAGVTARSRGGSRPKSK